MGPPTMRSALSTRSAASANPPRSPPPSSTSARPAPPSPLASPCQSMAASLLSKSVITSIKESMSTTNSTNLSAPDLTKRPPRSSRCRLGGYALLPRMLDKGRAVIAGKNGEYHYNCPLDQHILGFLGLDPEALRTELATGKGDGEILEWINENGAHKRTPWEIEQWSDYMQRRGPDSDAETLGYFAEAVARFTKTREDIRTWADLLDLDDYVSFGGQ